MSAASNLECNNTVAFCKILSPQLHLLLSLGVIYYYILYDCVPGVVQKIVQFLMKQMEYITLNKNWHQWLFCSTLEPICMLNWSFLKARDTEHRPALSFCAGILYQLSCPLTQSNNAILPILLSHPLLLYKTFFPLQNTYSLQEKASFYGG